MARPISAAGARTERVNLRLSVGEKAVLDENRQTQTESDYIRRLILSDAKRKREKP